MVSWLELYQQGVRSFARDIQVPEGPEGDRLEIALRNEIHRRVPAMANPCKLEVPRSGMCDACGGWLPRGEGGWCPLCRAARSVYLRDRDQAQLRDAAE